MKTVLNPEISVSGSLFRVMRRSPCDHESGTEEKSDADLKITVHEKSGDSILTPENVLLLIYTRFVFSSMLILLSSVNTVFSVLSMEKD